MGFVSSRLSMLALVAVLAPLRPTTVLKITDSRGTEVSVTGASIDYGGLIASDRETDGIRVLQGDAQVLVKWTEVTKLAIMRTDTTVKPMRTEIEITLRSGKTVAAALYRKGYMRLSGKSELGDYSIDLDKVRSIMPVH